MKIFLYNTLSKKKEEFLPLKKGKVSIYTCGPTVYDYAHIGNLRTYIFEDLLIRTLLNSDYRVNHVINITDIGHLTSDADEGEDKMMKALKREGKEATPQAMKELAEKYSRAFKRDIAALNIFSNIDNPKYKITWAKATDHIKEQIKLIKKLLKKGYAYQTADGIYFNTSKLADYGKLTGQKLDEMKAGARVEKNPNKKNPNDFTLWISTTGKQKNHVMNWDSPFGKGFPGWHIECSAIAIKHLGKTLDIHCGGIDHIAVHHTNEIAQSEAATGKTFSHFWMHGEFLNVNKEKMAKSLNNFYTLENIKEMGATPMDFRYLCLNTHYRTPLNFSTDAIMAAKNARLGLIRQLIEVKERGEVIAGELDKFVEIINDDLNFPKALGYLWQFVKNNQYSREDTVTTILAFDKLLGLDLKLAWRQKKSLSIPQKVLQLMEERDAARKNKNFEEADRLRKEIEKKGYLIEDTPSGTQIKNI